jgi:hypothetical protein
LQLAATARLRKNCDACFEKMKKRLWTRSRTCAILGFGNSSQQAFLQKASIWTLLAKY